MFYSNVIYIYIYINCAPILTSTEIYHFTGQTDTASGTRLTPLV